jgi:hypothetical protein
MPGHSRSKNGVASASLCAGHPRLGISVEKRRGSPGQAGDDEWSDFVSDCKVHSPHHAGTHENFFIIFVDAIFTTLLKPPFTSTFDVIDAKRPRDCLCRARHAD